MAQAAKQSSTNLLRHPNADGAPIQNRRPGKLPKNVVRFHRLRTDERPHVHTPEMELIMGLIDLINRYPLVGLPTDVDAGDMLLRPLASRINSGEAGRPLCDAVNALCVSAPRRAY